MIDYILLAIYIIGAVLTWRSFTIGLLQSLELSGRIDDFDRGLAMFFGLLMSSIWPACLLIRALYRLVIKQEFLRTKKEVIAKQREELEKLRRMAREYQLPLGEEDRP